MDLCARVDTQATSAIHHGIAIDYMRFVVAPLRIAGEDGIWNFNVRVGFGLGDGQHIRREVVIGVPHCCNEVDVLALVAVFKPDTVGIY